MLRSKLYSRVRVRQLVGSADDYDSWKMNRIPPAVGDIGYLIDVLDAPGLPSKFVVEKSDSEGVTLWLADFLQEELQVVE